MCNLEFSSDFFRIMFKFTTSGTIHQTTIISEEKSQSETLLEKAMQALLSELAQGDETITLKMRETLDIALDFAAKNQERPLRGTKILMDAAERIAKMHQKMVEKDFVNKRKILTAKRKAEEELEREEKKPKKEQCTIQ